MTADSTIRVSSTNTPPLVSLKDRILRDLIKHPSTHDLLSLVSWKELRHDEHLEHGIDGFLERTADSSVGKRWSHRHLRL
jgi:hypothetical protein